MAPPILYRWDDGNAPVARGERRSLCDILYACLVTGYGTKPGAGWTREYVNATFDKAAFRNNPATGTGFFIQVDGTVKPASETYVHVTRGFETMSSQNDGLFPFYSGTGSGEFWTSSAIGTEARPWVLIADDRAFWLVCLPMGMASPMYKSEMFFGDIVKWKPDDAYACAMIVSSQYMGAYLMYSPPSTANGYLAMPRKYSGAVGPIAAALVRGGGPCDDSYPGNTGMPYTAGGPLLISRPHINDAVAHTLRGWLPGFYVPCHPYTAFDYLQVVTVEGKSFINVRGYMVGGQFGSYFISLDDWRA